MTPIITSKDVCDEPHCYDQAEVRVIAKTDGYLEFCAHHYDRHLKSEKGARNMAAFALEVIDEREFFSEKPVENLVV